MILEMVYYFCWGCCCCCFGFCIMLTFRLHSMPLHKMLHQSSSQLYNYSSQMYSNLSRFNFSHTNSFNFGNCIFSIEDNMCSNLNHYEEETVLWIYEIFQQIILLQRNSMIALLYHSRKQKLSTEMSVCEWSE